MARSQIFLYACISFLFGVLIASFIELKTPMLIGAFVFSLVVFLIGMLKKSDALIFSSIFLLISLFGAFWFLKDAHQIPIEAYSRFNGAYVTLSGYIADEPDVRNVQKLVIQGKEISINGENVPFSYKVLVQTRPYPAYIFGDSVSISGTIQSPEYIKDFDYPSFLAKDGIYFLIYNPRISILAHEEKSFAVQFEKKLFSIKHAFVKSIEEILPEPHASFLVGLLLGDRRSIPKDFIEDLQKTGTTHIIALSGFNITIIADNFLRLLQALAVPFAGAFWISLFAIGLFVVMVGAHASIVRAAIMGILVLIARRHSRLYDVRLALLFAAAVMVFLHPYILRFDVSFQLSFLATLGMVFIAPKLGYFFQWVRIGLIRETLVATLSAELAVLPLLIFYFGGVSMISPLANLLVLALIPFTMLSGFLASIGGLIAHIFGIFFGLIAWVPLQYEISVISFFAKFPFSFYEFSVISLFLFVPLYVFILWRILTYIPYHHERNN